MLFSTAGTAGKARLTIAPDGPPGEGSGLQEHIRGETGGRRGPAGRHRAASGGPRRGSGRGRRQGEPEWQAVSPTACRSGPPGPGLPIKKERLVLQQTSNYQLSQWDAEDRIQRADFNSDNAKVDAALEEINSTLAEHMLAIAKCGNCNIWMTTYQGSQLYGPGNPTSITFPGTPAFYLWGGPYMVVAGRGGETRPLAITSSGASYIGITWNGNTASCYSESGARYQMNDSSYTYWVLAFYMSRAE